MGNICLGAGLNKSRFLSGIADSVPSQLWKSQDKPPSEDPTLPPPTIQIPSYHHPSSKNSDPTSTSQSGTNQPLNQKPTSESQNYLQPSSANKKSTSETKFSQGPTAESTSYEEPRVYQESRNSQKPSSESRNPQEPTLEFRFSEEPLKELKNHQETKPESRKTENSESTNSHGLESESRHYQESASKIGISSESSRNYQESTSESDIYHEPSTELEESEGDQNQEEEEEMNRFGAEAGGSHSARVLNEKTANVRDLYTLGRRLGQGQFGTTYLCMEKGTDNVFACKSIAKRKLLSKDDVEDVRREIQIMHHLAGHPNVVMIKGAYEDVASVHLVMELCAGGELFDRIIERGHYTERKAAELTRTIVGVVEACHSLGVMHRDLKPENFLLSSTSEDSPLKATDFGLSIFFKPGENFSDVVGSPYYVAPEVLQKNYGIEADIWSAGVILYILLSGVPPFWAETEHGIFEQVLHGELDFQSDPWPIISDSAKDLISKMLDRDPKKRPTAHEVLCHPWIKEDGIAPDRPLDSAVLSRLKQFSAMNKIKKMALRVIAESLSEDEIAGLKEMFKMMDTDNSGSITFDELKDGLNRVGANLMESEIRALMEAADIDNSGTIDYGEFIAATLHLNKMEREENLHSAFAYFDKDGSGYITIDELQQACQDFGIDDGRLEEMIQEVDQDNDGRIDFDEFVAMMRKESGGIGRKTMQNNLDLRDALKIV